MTFLDEDYLLTNATAKRIFPEIQNLPILDAHNHANVKEIADNNNYTDLWQVEAASDHYMWELMRKRGVSEEYITGSQPNHEKWIALANVFNDFVGNPCYEWVHLDLQRRLELTKLINAENAEDLWNESQSLFAQEDKTPQALLREMNVEVMCSTDDPTDRLEYHQQLQAVANIPRVLPTWRPDKAMNIFKPDYNDYIRKLAARVDREIHNIDDLIGALQETHDYFDSMGCRASDHGIQIPFGYSVDNRRANIIFTKRLSEDVLTKKETQDFMAFMFQQFGEMNAKSGWVMQIHIGAVRDIRDTLYQQLGPDTGGDISDHTIEIVNPLKQFLNRFDDQLKVVLYSLDPSHWGTLATLTRTFGAKTNLGAAWWFNDSPIGMRRQLEYIGTLDLLMNFAGMVTDSRKLMSYGSRTEMFRRVLSDSLGLMVEKGQMPEDLALRVAKYVCYEGPKAFFGF